MSESWPLLQFSIKGARQSQGHAPNHIKMNETTPVGSSNCNGRLLIFLLKFVQLLYLLEYNFGIFLIIKDFFDIFTFVSFISLDGTNKTEQRLETSDSDYSEALRIKYQTEYRRNKLDMSSGFTDLKAQSTDTYVREFIEKLKEKRESSKSSPSETRKSDETLNDDK